MIWTILANDEYLHDDLEMSVQNDEYLLIHLDIRLELDEKYIRWKIEKLIFTYWVIEEYEEVRELNLMNSVYYSQHFQVHN